MRLLLCLIFLAFGCKTVENEKASLSLWNSSDGVRKLIAKARLNPSAIKRKLGVELEFSLASSAEPDNSLPFLKNFLIARGVVKPANPVLYRVEQSYDSIERLEAFCNLSQRFLSCVVDMPDKELYMLRHSMSEDINSSTLYQPPKEVLAKESKITDGNLDSKKTNAIMYRLHHPLQKQIKHFSAELRCVFLSQLDVLKCGKSFQHQVNTIESADQFIESVFRGTTLPIFEAKGPYLSKELGELDLQLDASAGYEIATKPLSYDQLKSAQGLVDSLTQLGAYAEKEKPFYSLKLYGLHVNIDFGPQEFSLLPQVFARWYKISPEVKRYFKPSFVRTFNYARRPAARTIKGISALQGRPASEIKKELVDIWVNKGKLIKEQELNLLPYLEKAANNRSALEFRVFDGAFRSDPGYGAFGDVPYFSQAVLFAGQFTSKAAQASKE